LMCFALSNLSSFVGFFPRLVKIFVVYSGMAMAM